MKIRYVDQPDGPALKYLTCACGAETRLNDQRGDWTCRCRQEYNAFGQALAHPDQWEEADDYDPEPGESAFFRDCVHFDMGTSAYIGNDD